MGSRHRPRGAAASIALGIVLLAATTVRAADAQEFDSIIVVDQAAGTVSYTLPDSGPVILVDGLVNPRGVALSPDGSILVVAESGDSPGTGRLIGVQPDLTAQVLVDGLDFPEGVAFVADDILVVSSPGDQTLSEYVLGTSSIQTLITIESAPTGLVALQPPTNGGPIQLAVSTWNGLGLIVDSAGITPFTDLLGGGGHPDYSPDTGVCIPEFEQNHVSCWPLDGGSPTLFPGFDGPTGVVILPDGLLAVSDSAGVHLVDPRDGSILRTLPFENPAAMVVPGDRSAVWLPAVAPEPEPEPVVTTTTTTPSTTLAPPAAEVTTTAVEPSATTAAPVASDVTPDAATAPPDGTSSDSGSSALWWLLLAIPMLALLFAALRRRSTAPAVDPAAPSAPGERSPEPVTRPVVSAADPCHDLCEAAKKAEAEATKAEAEAAASAEDAAEAERVTNDHEKAAAEADRQAGAANKAANDADSAATKARTPKDHSGGRAKSGDREYTGADNDRVNAESERIDGAVAAGDMTQAEAQAEKATLRDPEKWKQLRDKEEHDHQQQVEKAEQKAARAREAQREAKDEAERARTESDNSAKAARDQRELADRARESAERSRAEATDKRRACEKCRRDAAIEAAGGPDSWKVAQGGVGGPCQEADQPLTITNTETFFVFDETREVEVTDESIRPERIDAASRGLIRRVFSTVGRILGVGSMVPAIPLVVKLPMKYLSFISKGAAGILEDLDKALDKSRRDGGLSDYYFVKVTIPRKKVTVTCTCTVECVDGVRRCTGCATTETSAPGDLVKTSEGPKAEMAAFVSGMQAQARQAGSAADRRDAFVSACTCD